jgi:hypothetical protein
MYDLFIKHSLFIVKICEIYLSNWYIYKNAWFLKGSNKFTNSPSKPDFPSYDCSARKVFPAVQLAGVQPVIFPQVCFCSPGFEESEMGDCLDINECEADNGGCEEECHNKPGSYICRSFLHQSIPPT